MSQEAGTSFYLTRTFNPAWVVRQVLRRRADRQFVPLAVLPVILVLAGCRIPETRTNGRPDGRKLYLAFCAACHGADGRKGRGPADLARAAGRSDAEIRSVIENGRGAMPGWKRHLKEDEIAVVTQFVRRLTSVVRPPPGRQDGRPVNPSSEG
jgi:mono/diheme cytochrome c family protein